MTRYSTAAHLDGLAQVSKQWLSVLRQRLVLFDPEVSEVAPSKVLDREPPRTPARDDWNAIAARIVHRRAVPAARVPAGTYSAPHREIGS